MFCASVGLAGEQFVEAADMGFEQVDAFEAANHALAVLGTAVGLALSIRFLQPEVHGLDFMYVITIVIQTRSLNQ